MSTKLYTDHRRRRAFRAATFTTLLLSCAAAAGSASADPCKAISDSGRPAPWLKAKMASGEPITGTVRHVGDGDSLCIGDSPDPTRWVEIRLADFDAPELNEPAGPAARETLRRITAGRAISCRGRRISWDRLVARCTIGSRSLGDLMRQTGVREGGR